MNVQQEIFVIAGMPKAATTFLYFTLGKHPDIYAPARKEIDYFSDVHYRKGYNWYINLFKEKKAPQIGMDCTPVYFMDNSAIKRMKEFNPDIKVILIIRNPVDWVISFYKHMGDISVQRPDIKSFVTQGLHYKKEGIEQHVVFNNGFVKKRIQEYVKEFGSNLLLLNFSLIEQTPLEAIIEIEKFIGISNYFNENNVENIKLNSSDKKSIPILSYLKRNKLFVSSVTKIFPPRLIFRVNEKLHRLLLNKSAPSEPSTNYEIPFIKEQMKEDTEYFYTLFNDSKIVIPKPTH